MLWAQILKRSAQLVSYVRTRWRQRGCGSCSIISIASGSRLCASCIAQRRRLATLSPETTMSMTEQEQEMRGSGPPWAWWLVHCTDYGDCSFSPASGNASFWHSKLRVAADAAATACRCRRRCHCVHTNGQVRTAARDSDHPRMVASLIASGGYALSVALLGQ